MMKTDLKNLNLSWCETPRDDWLDDLEAMVDGYPFEQARRERAGLDSLEYLRSTWDSPEGSPELLAAYFGDKLVGWLQSRKNPPLSEVLPSKARSIRHELVQRNRDDVRYHLLEALNDRFPDDLLEFKQPSQNRTARSYLLDQPHVYSGRILNLLGREIDRDPQTNNTRNNPTELLENRSRKTNFSSLTYDDFSLDKVGLPERYREPYLREVTRSYRQGSNTAVLLLSGTEDPIAAAYLQQIHDNQDNTPMIQANLLMGTMKPDYLADLLAGLESHLLDQWDQCYLEIQVDSENDFLFESLQDEGFEPTGKHMFFHRIPEALQELLNVPTGANDSK